MFRQRIKEMLGICLGALIFSFGLNYFIIANHLAEGGLTGVALILYYLFNLPVGATYMILNVPLLIFSWRVVGREFALKTLFGTAAVSLAIDLTSMWKEPMEDMLLAALYGGSVMGLGLGVIFLFGGSSGGVDIIARAINQKKGWPVGRALLIVDAVVIAAVGLFFGREVFMYTLVAVFVATNVIDFVQDGAYSAKALTIISNASDAIAKRIAEDLDRGATIFSAKGAFTSQERSVLYCVVSRTELFKIKSLIREIDPQAFVIVNEVHEVLGEGFRDWK